LDYVVLFAVRVVAEEEEEEEEAEAEAAEEAVDF
jgi:hypothetical protein